MVTISKFSNQNPRYINLLKRRSNIPTEVEAAVRDVLNDVKERGNEALYFYMKEFDNVDINEIGLFVSEKELANAREKVSEEFKDAVQKACIHRSIVLLLLFPEIWHLWFLHCI